MRLIEQTDEGFLIEINMINIEVLITIFHLITHISVDEYFINNLTMNRDDASLLEDLFLMPAYYGFDR